MAPLARSFFSTARRQATASSSSNTLAAPTRHASTAIARNSLQRLHVSRDSGSLTQNVHKVYVCPNLSLAREFSTSSFLSSEKSSGREEKAKDREAIGPFNSRAAILFVVTGIGLFFYFQSEKAAVEDRKRAESAQAKIGRPKIGGEFELVMPTPTALGQEAKNVEGRKFTEQDLKGAFSLVYFGFTNCPDICPEELDKMAQIVDRVDTIHGPVINPIFVTCDPARDTLAATSVYVSEFHPRLVGLTGSYEAVKAACKAYRVYFSTPPGADPSGDYLVDHSIFFYLMDPDGKFVDAFGRSVGPDDATKKVLSFIDQWKEAGNPIGRADAKEKVLLDESRRVPLQ